MKNFISNGHTVNHVVGADGIAAGDVVVQGQLAGVSATTGVENDTVAVTLQGVFSVAKVTGAVTLGQNVYFNATEKKVTTTVGSNVLVGQAMAAAASGDTEVAVRLKG